MPQSNENQDVTFTLEGETVTTQQTVWTVEEIITEAGGDIELDVVCEIRDGKSIDCEGEVTITDGKDLALKRKKADVA